MSEELTREKLVKLLSARGVKGTIKELLDRAIELAKKGKKSAAEKLYFLAVGIHSMSFSVCMDVYGLSEEECARILSGEIALLKRAREKLRELGCDV